MAAMKTNHIYQGDCLVGLMRLSDNSVDCCVTSPPYYGLRDYQNPEQIGMEETPEAFIAKLVTVFAQVRRVLKPTGTCWINIGDSYKDKSLVGIPWMLAFSLRTDGWFLRQEIIWSKPNPMPESVTDRCAKAHESIFLLTKSAKYYYDADAIKEPSVKGPAGSEFHTGKTGEHQLGRASTKPRNNADSFKRTDSKRAEVIPGQTVGTHRPDREESSYSLETRNKRSVWTVATTPFSEAHFATYPPELIVPCIKAGCPVGGVVLDPFMGAGTTALVAAKLGRQYVGFELNAEYIRIAERRLERELGPLTALFHP